MANNIDVKVSDNTVKIPVKVSTKSVNRSVESEQFDPFYVGATAKVEQLASGALITCKDKDGTTTAQVYDGTDGQDGRDGVDGQDGANGFSPIIEIESITDGHRITITDAEQTQTVDIMDGEDGTDGQDGRDGTEGVGIVSIVQNADYTLTITLSDGTMLTTEPVIGQKGDTGATGNGIASATLNADYTLTLTFTDGTSYTTTSIRGERGATGETGNGIDSIDKTATVGLVDTYTITFTDGTTTTFDVTNGKNGSGSVVDVTVDGVSVLVDNVAEIDLSGKADVSSLSAVATSGAYADLSGKPSIPSKTSDLQNDSGYISGYTETDPLFLASAAYSIVAADISNWNAKSDFSGDYDDLSNKPTLSTVATSGNYADLNNKPTVPTKTSQLQNDSGFLTSHQDISGKADKADTDIDASVITLFTSLGWTQPT